MNRRTLIGVSGLALAAAGCNEARRAVSPNPNNGGTSPITGGRGAELKAGGLLLRRATFGPSAWESERLEKLGTKNWLDEQLDAPLGNAESEGESVGFRFRLAGLESLTEDGYELRDSGEDLVLAQLQQAALLRAAYSKWQLRERLADLFTNHFNIYEHKVFTPQTEQNTAAELAFLLGKDQRDVIRRNCLGSFDEMLKESMNSPAMLGYLDNQISERAHPNENYARELLELHTLGVNGGYTQKDVMEVARCLTGWGIEDRFMRHHGAVRWEPNRHDDGEKVVLGVRIPAGGGEKDAERVREILISHPSTARFIARKLVRGFWGTGTGEDKLIKTVSEAWGKKGDLKAMTRALLTHPDFSKAPKLLRRPLDFTIAALRATGAETDGGPGIQRHLTTMGQLAFSWPMPDGYPDRTSAWTGSLLARWNFALALASGGIDGTSLPTPLSDWEPLALSLCAPEFHYK